MPRQIVRKTPFPTGYSESARVNADFGDWDDYEVGEMPGSAAELEQDRRANSPLYRENLRFKNPNDLANSIDDDVEYDDDYERSWGPAPKTRDDARKYLRAALGNDRQNTVFEGYEDYLARNGKPSAALDDTLLAYPKGHWQNILNDEGFLDEVAGDLDDSNYDSTIEVSDEDIEKMLAQKGYIFR